MALDHGVNKRNELQEVGRFKFLFDINYMSVFLVVHVQESVHVVLLYKINGATKMSI